jgi:ribonuclease HI
MPWVSRLLRGDRVYVRAAADGRLQTGSDGRVDIVYGKKGGKLYRAAARNLEDDPTPERLSDEEVLAVPSAEQKPLPGLANGKPAAGKPAAKARPVGSGGAAKPAPVDPVIVYADGACSGNPGPCGIGVVILDGKEREEISEYLGTGTNNIGELTAIIRALERVPRDRTVIIHSDSSYALGLLGQGWKAKANQDLVERMRKLAAGFRDLRLVKVAGHAGVVENERADALARDAVNRKS